MERRWNADELNWCTPSKIPQVEPDVTSQAGHTPWLHTHTHVCAGRRNKEIETLCGSASGLRTQSPEAANTRPDLGSADLILTYHVPANVI